MMDIMFAMGICGFHVGITLLALYRAYRALGRANAEGRVDAGTMWRLSLLRLCGVPVAISGFVLGLIAPMFFVTNWFPSVFLGYEEGLALVSAGAWLIWIPSTIVLDNIARRWI